MQMTGKKRFHHETIQSKSEKHHFHFNQSEDHKDLGPFEVSNKVIVLLFRKEGHLENDARH